MASLKNACPSPASEQQNPDLLFQQDLPWWPVPLLYFPDQDPPLPTGSNLGDCAHHRVPVDGAF